MIDDGDRIAIGLSGGKDSLTLLWTLQERLARIPIAYSLVAIYVDLGFDSSPAPLIEQYCRKMGYPLHVEHTNFGVLGHSEENRENPCFSVPGSEENDFLNWHINMAAISLLSATTRTTSLKPFF